MRRAEEIKLYLKVNNFILMSYVLVDVMYGFFSV